MINLSRQFENAVEPLSKRALQMDTSARRAWLNELRADCPTVARELERQIQRTLESSAAVHATYTTSAVVPGSLDQLGLREC